MSRRAELLALAARMFAERGFLATTVRDIADAAGILSGSLYHHFGSKEEMVDELLDSFQTRLWQEYDEIESSDRRLHLAASIINLRSRLLCSATGDQAIFVRRDLFDSIGGFPEVALCEDLETLAADPRVLQFALEALYAIGPPPWPLKKLSARLDKPLRAAFRPAVNRALADDTSDGRFMTLLFARLDPVTRSLEYMSAGHTTSYLLDASGTQQQVRDRLEVAFAQAFA